MGIFPLGCFLTTPLTAIHYQLYTLYLIPSNFRSVAERLYIHPTSNNPFVRLALAYQLRQAAMAELLKQCSIVDVEALYRGAERAFEALSELLGEDAYFFSLDDPGLFDASIFAYTHLLLDKNMGWSDTRLQASLRNYGKLVEHRNRLLDKFF